MTISMDAIWAILYYIASWTIQGVLLVIGGLTVYMYAQNKPEGRPWRCHFWLHSWKREGHRQECRHCGDRQNDLVGFHRLKMGLRGLNRLLDKVGAMHAAKQQDWQTPIELFRWIEEEMGFKFTLDPCAPPENNLGTAKFYTEADDGLKQTWVDQKVFMNPPYGNLPAWIEKAHKEAVWGDTTVVGLLPVRTSPKYMRAYVWTLKAKLLPSLRYARELRRGQIGIFFLPKRVRFIDPGTGKKAGSPYFDSMVVVWR